MTTPYQQRPLILVYYSFCSFDLASLHNELVIAILAYRGFEFLNLISELSQGLCEISLKELNRFIVIEILSLRQNKLTTLYNNLKSFQHIC